ncbi:hypothetical protein ACJJTC_019273 [Scirpophaga incertulas]
MSTERATLFTSRDKSPCRAIPRNESDSKILSECVLSRGIIKGRLTKLSQYIDKISDQPLSSQNRIDLKLRIQGATGLFSEFCDLQTQIEKMVIDSNIDAQLSYREMFEDKYYCALSLAEHILESTEVWAVS